MATKRKVSILSYTEVLHSGFTFIVSWFSLDCSGDSVFTCTVFSRFKTNLLFFSLSVTLFRSLLISSCEQPVASVFVS